MTHTPENFNPYEAPVAADNWPLAPVEKSYGRKLIGWIVILLLNLPVPLFFGQSIVSGAGTVGMMLAILTILVAGVFATFRFPQLIEVLQVGGIVTALSQFMPILHFIAGAVAIGITEQITSVANGDESNVLPEGVSFLGGFCATSITAGIVLLVAAAIGAVIQVLRGRWPGRSPVSTQERSA